MLLCGLASGLGGTTVLAQVRVEPAQSANVKGSFETRSQLEAEAKAAESQHRTAEAFVLRSRLKNGDFQEGDRIVMVMENTGKADTLQVRSGKVIQFIGMGDLSLEGVLRSELADTMKHHLSKYLRNPQFRVTPLLPIAVFGSVGNPGYYYTAADVVLRDLVMMAGGPGTSGDLNKTVVRRGGETLWDASAVRVALADGLSIDRLHLRAGDQVVVPERRRFGSSTVIAILSVASSLAVVAIQLAR